MRGKIKLAVGVCVVAFGNSPALADPYYFNKPGVAREAYASDVAECRELAGGADAPNAVPVYAPNLVAAAVGGLFAGIMNGREDRRMQRSVERLCMADKGYTRFTIGDADAEAIRKLDGEERVRRLFALAADAKPKGRKLAE